MMNLYACGGTGVNIAKKVKDGIANVIYVDSSKSNIKSVKSSQVYLIEGMEGAGKYRRATYDEFLPVANDVLIKFKPSDELNIVLGGLSGGSGSVIAPMLVSKLIEAGKTVIVIGIESLTSFKEIENAIDTLKTYKGISTLQKKSVALFYLTNEVRKETDDKAIWFINLMAVIVDKTKTEEFDTSDLANFVNFDKVTDNQPNVGFLDIRENIVFTPEKNTVIVSTIHTTMSVDDPICLPTPEYLATCVITDGSAVEKINARIDNILGALAHQITQLTKLMTSYKENKIVNKVSDIKVDESNDNGFVV